MAENIYQAIAAIMKEENTAVEKDAENKNQHFKYRGIDAVMNTYNPLLAKHGVFMVPTVLEQTREERKSSNGGNLVYSILKIKYTFYASDGSSVEATVIGEGMDSGDKASNKAMAVGMKYALFQTFCIPTEEMGADDPDAESHSVEPKKVPKPEPKPSAEIICEYCEKQPVKKENGGGKWSGRYACGDCVARFKAQDK